MKKILSLTLFFVLNITGMENQPPVFPSTNSGPKDDLKQCIERYDYDGFKSDFANKHGLKHDSQLFSFLGAMDKISNEELQKINNQFASTNDFSIVKNTIKKDDLENYKTITKELLEKKIEALDADTCTKIIKGGGGMTLGYLGYAIFFDADQHYYYSYGQLKRFLEKSFGVTLWVAGALMIKSMDNDWNSDVSNLKKIEQLLTNMEQNKSTLDSIAKKYQ